MKELVGVYLLQSPSDRCYVGMTCDSFERRWKGHLKELRRGVHPTPGLTHAYGKYGWEAIEKVVLEAWVKPSSLKELGALQKEVLKRERYWWEQIFMDGAAMLHGCPTGTGSVIHTSAARVKIAESMVSTPRNRNSQEVQVKLEKHLEELRRLAADPRVSVKRMAELHEVSLSQMKRFLAAHSIPSVTGRVNSEGKLLKDYPLLSWYFDEKLSTREIASRAGFSQPAVVYFFNSLKKEDSRFTLVKERQRLRE